MEHKIDVKVVPDMFSDEEVTAVDNPATEASRRQHIEQVVNEDIAGFDQFFQKAMKNDPLIKPERAIIKTYLAYKLGIAKVRS